MAKFYYQGHGSCRFVTQNNTVIYLDPFAGDGYDLPADLVLITHDHYDHNALHLVTRKPDAIVITQNEALAGGRHNHFFEKGVAVEAVMAQNKNHDPAKCVGYILTMDGISIYASGDTSETPQMASFKDRNLDYALLAADGVYNMDAKEASRCAHLIGAKVSIPIHTKPKALFDRAVAEQFEAPNRLIVEPGQEIEL
jgi:L-ascorbate metabolism protein UlaG (beta-lactamase superfamily)